MGKGNLIMDKSFAFAIRIVRLYKLLCEHRKELVLSKQILRSGTAVGALIKESEHAQSKADFINKLSIALKEANETEYWLMLLKESDYLSADEYNSIIEALISEKIIDSISHEEKVGAGEMQFIKYNFQAISGDISYNATLVQSNTLEDSRVFSLYLTNKNNAEEKFDYYIQLYEEGRILIYDTWQEEWK